MASAASQNNLRTSSASRNSPSTTPNNAVNSGSSDKRESLACRAKSGKSFAPRNNLASSSNTNGAKQRNFSVSQNKVARGPRSRNLQPSLQYGACHARQPHNDFKVTGADEFEIGSVFNAGSKKQNLNHLLNFQFESGGTSRYNQRGGRRSQKFRGVQPPKSKYKKEQYLQANCQFVVKAEANLEDFLSNPDGLVNWELIEQVGLKTSAVPSCPICLYPPRAAKIAKCGHIYCWSCMLHYFALSDDDYRKCPICYDFIYKDDLKSVVSLLHSEKNTGDEIEMFLMRRERESMFAVPVEKYNKEIEGKHPSISQKWTSYSKILTANPNEVSDIIINREKCELDAQFNVEKDEPEACFIERALQLLAERKNAVLSGWDGKKSESPGLSFLQEEDESLKEEEKEILSFNLANSVDDDDEIKSRTRHRLVSSSSDGGSSIEVEDEVLESDEIKAEDLDISNVQPANKEESKVPGARKDTFFFYQSSDGQAIFLHALNVQMLVEEYGSLENCPKVLKGKILEKDNTTMTEDLRNKLRYLRHMPLTSTFEVCELKMTQPLVSSKTIAKFQNQLDYRRKLRSKRARDEKRREKRIQVETNRLMGKYPEAKLRIESNFHFPLVGSPVSTLSTRLTTSTETLLGTSDSSERHDQKSSLSFAGVVRDGVARPSSNLQMTRSETLPSGLSSSINTTAHSDSEPEPEGYVPPPRMANFGDALALALAIENAKSKEVTSGGKKKGKKVKGTKILLTSAPRPGL